MMACLFKSTELAKISNLAGKKSYYIYTTATTFCHTIYQEFKHFSLSDLQNIKITISTVDLTDINYAYTTFQEVYYSLTNYTKIWLNMDLSKSSCITDLILILLKHFKDNRKTILIFKFKSETFS